MNPIRMSFITDQISKHRSMKIKHETSGYEPFKGLRVLDVGCGGGLLSESMARLGASVIAIDPSVEVAKAAQTHSQQDAKTSSIDYRGGTSVEELAAQEQGTFDVVCVLEVIEHATDPRSLMEAAVTLLKKPDGGDPGGMLFVSTINRTAKSFGIAIVGGEYISGKLPIGTHSWNQFLSPAEVNGLVGEFGLDEVDKKGMILRLPLYDMRWYFDDNDLDVNWIGSYSHRT
jgi:2-polyprenyl-6-hydroxyphenyl methylase/3-demethylubiquinone-9 3-methyltransferase